MSKKIDIPTFEPTSLVDIENFISRVNNLREETISDEFLVLNLTKTIDSLNNAVESDLINTKSRKLIYLLVNLTFKTKLKSTQLREHLIRLNFYQMFKRTFNYIVSLQDFVYEHKHQDLAFLIASLNNLTFESEAIVKENVKQGIVKLAIDCLRTTDYLTKLNNNQLTSKESLYLFDNIVRFLLSNCEESVIKQELNSLNIIPVILDNQKKLNEALKRYPRMIELKTIEVRLVCILACLMNDNELEKEIGISQEIVEKLIQMLNDTIKKSKSNVMMLNTKFYITYEINMVPTYVYARSVMKRFLNISVNDTIKKLIFEKNGLPPIIKLLTSGNEKEQHYSSELLCSLCFNEEVKRCLRDDIRTMKLIESLVKNNSKSSDVKNNCTQIIDMVNQKLEKRIAFTETQSPTMQQQKQESEIKTVMISYSSKYKDKCLKLNEELKKRGFNTWIDVEKMSKNIFDGMAEAVENSSIVLVCYSEEYRKSANCRLEAEYAYKQNKPIVFVRVEPNYQPQGWIGLMMGQKLYVDFSSDEVQKTINEIVKQIGEYTTGTVKTGEIKSTTSDNDVKNWSKKEIESWLLSNSLKEFIPVFSDYDGLSFLALWKLKSDNNDRFYESIDAEMKEKRIEVPNRKKLLFYMHFKNLFSN